MKRGAGPKFYAIPGPVRLSRADYDATRLVYISEYFAHLNLFNVLEMLNRQIVY